MFISNPELLAASRDAARGYYSNLPFHNWDHVESAVEYALWRIPRLEEHGIAVNPDIVLDALYWHDSDYDKDHVKLGFSSKEALSAYEGQKNLTEIGRDIGYITSVVHSIRATEFGQPRDTNEAMLTVEADIHNVAGNTNKFIVNGIKLAAEQLQLGRVLPSDAATFFCNSANFLHSYLKLPLAYTGADGEEIVFNKFSLKASRNIDAMRSLSVKALQAIPECLQLIPETWVK